MIFEGELILSTDLTLVTIDLKMFPTGSNPFLKLVAPAKNPSETLVPIDLKLLNI